MSLRGEHVASVSKAGMGGGMCNFFCSEALFCSFANGICWSAEAEELLKKCFEYHGMVMVDVSSTWNRLCLRLLLLGQWPEWFTTQFVLRRISVQGRFGSLFLFIRPVVLYFPGATRSCLERHGYIEAHFDIQFYIFDVFFAVSMKPNFTQVRCFYQFWVPFFRSSFFKIIFFTRKPVFLFAMSETIESSSSGICCFPSFQIWSLHAGTDMRFQEEFSLEWSISDYITVMGSVLLKWYHQLTCNACSSYLAPGYRNTAETRVLLESCSSVADDIHNWGVFYVRWNAIEECA